MKLVEFVKQSAITEISFSRIEKVLSDNNEVICILHLDKPLDSVTGSQVITDDASGEAIRVNAYDVESVKVHQNDISDEGFDVEEDGTGTYSGDTLRLDVAKRSGEVWLRAESFSASARKMRRNSQTERQGGMLAKIKSRSQSSTEAAPVKATVVATKE